jgi:hypothetical protein
MKDGVRIHMENSQEITIRLNNAQSPDEAAMLLEVIAGEIRNGRECGNDPECSWKTQPV